MKVGSHVLVQLYNGKRMDGIVKRIEDTLSGIKVCVGIPYKRRQVLSVLVDAAQIVEVFD